MKTENVIWDFFVKPRGYLDKKREERLNDPVIKQLMEQVAERLDLPQNTPLDELARTLKLMSEEERKQKLQGIVS